MNIFFQFYCCIIIVMISTFSCSQNLNDKTAISRENAEYLLKEVIANNKLHNIIDSNYTVIKNEKTLINVIEPILFDIYGQENIEKQKPYKVHNFDNYYVVGGSLESGKSGGNFLLIINKKNAEILKITHEK